MNFFDPPIRDPVILERARLTFELSAAAERIMYQNLRRRHPEADEGEIERRFAAWLQKSDEEYEGFGRPSPKWDARLRSGS